MEIGEVLLLDLLQVRADEFHQVGAVDSGGCCRDDHQPLELASTTAAHRSQRESSGNWMWPISMQELAMPGCPSTRRRQCRHGNTP